MSGKSRVLGLMALQEKAKIAGTLSDLREAARQKDEAERMVARLQEALARQGKGEGVRLAAEVMAERAMAAQILTETERHRARQEAFAARMAEEQAKLARQEHRHQTLADKAKAAKRSEAEERLALREATQPPRRR
ncbi:hypothetical protein C0V75_14540 [Tabrizicola sp. TH137]|uniref:hypothetical protein n=1 Tax=Tabrizicola sp. TH137 TaxID=2067452 RepID=UPI000C7E3315|nr:hypothetical protein [Tabrizicola sp. TH137]PLL12097.1 hypothetical protein C0V75_14540 [Tabrizicola sp. TH137]